MKTVIFDLDGTLADSKDMLEDVSLSLVKKHLPPGFTKKDFAQYRDKNPSQIIKLLKINKFQLLCYVLRGRKMIKASLSLLPELKTF